MSQPLKKPQIDLFQQLQVSISKQYFGNTLSVHKQNKLTTTKFYFQRINNKQSIKYIVKTNMSQLFMSSNKKKPHQEPIFTLQNLSPQKYGKAAFTNLTYTPSKLADNVLYKDFSNQKKIEEGTSKLRETQTLNSIFQDRLSELQEEKEGIEKTLNEQITMYKKMLKEKQEKNEKRIKTIQDSFNNEIKELLKQKQEQAKFYQSQKQLLQAKIAQIQQTKANLQSQLDEYDNNHRGLKDDHEKLEIQYENLEKRYDEAEKNAKKAQQKLKQQLQGLKRHIFESNIQAEKKLQKQLKAKDKQIENLQRIHRNELQKIQNKRAQQVLLKNQELKDLASTFQKETQRLNSIISKKQQQISSMNKAIQAEKQRAFAASKSYENQITSLTHQKSRLKQQLLKTQRKLQKLTAQYDEISQKYQNLKTTSQQQINKLLKDLQMNQIYYLGQMDKLQYNMDESTKQMVRLKVDNQNALSLREQNAILHREVRQMKQLLVQSSNEIDKCKEEFAKIYREKDILAIKLRELGLENETLYLIKNSREQEARGWRDSYFIQKKKY